MGSTNCPEISGISFTIHFVQGYRYLDHCGDALVYLLKILNPGWIVVNDPTPSGGNMRNFALGLSTTFNSKSVTIQQTEFIDTKLFIDQASKILEVLVRIFEINTLNVPALNVSLQIGFPDVEQAEQYISRLSHVTPGASLLDFLQGNIYATSYVFVTTGLTDFLGEPSTFRNRLSVRSTQKAKQPDFDSRILQRVSLIAPQERRAVREILDLRAKHVSAVTVAVDIDFEQTLEREFDTRFFSIADFLSLRLEKASVLAGSLPITG